MNHTDIRERNARLLAHEAETPPRGHDADGRCCNDALTRPRPLTDAEVRRMVAGWVARERAIGLRAIRVHTNDVRHALGMPTVEAEAFTRAAKAVAAIGRAFGQLVPAARIGGDRG